MSSTVLAAGLFSVAALSLATPRATAAQAPGDDPPYVTRGRQTEGRQRAYHDRIDRFYQALSGELRGHAPDLVETLEPPPPGIFGYGILPRIVPDPPPTPPAKPQVVSYSWGWSDTLIAREMATLDRLETDLATIPANVDRKIYERLAADYKTVVDHRRLIDSDIAYNWLWQAAIAADRQGFDRVTKLLDAAVQRQTQSEPLTPEIVANMRAYDPPTFLRLEQPADRQWVLTVPLRTDITDVAFVQTFRDAVETAWHVRTAQGEFRLKLAIEVLSPDRMYCGADSAENHANAPAGGCAPPAKGNHIDLAAHAARFPKDAVRLTTGATSLRIIKGPTLVLAPYDVAPRVLAHEFGHLLGLPDFYFRGYRDLGTEGFRVMELVPDTTDIMASPSTGLVFAHHFEGLIAAREVQELMQAGLDALYTRNAPLEAAARFREVLARNPMHYGATLQLAKALDLSGQTDEALAVWKKMLDMAETARDAETARTARTRLTGGF